MTAPAIRAYLGLGSTWKTADASIVWTNVTPWVRKNPEWDVDRGRSSELDDFRAGSCSLALKNDDRRFDPSHASGPYFGQLLPGVPLKLTATPSGGSEVQVFRGFVQGWPQDGDRNLQQVVRIRATDGLAKLATAGLPSSVYALEVASDSPDAWYRLNEEAGTIMGDSAGTNHGTYNSGQTFYSRTHPNRYESDQQAIDIPKFGVGAYSFTADTAADILDGDTWPTTITFIAQLKDDETSFGLFVATSDVTDVGIGAPGPRLYAFDGTEKRSDVISYQQPHHYAVRNTGSGTFVFYIDGVSVTVNAGVGDFAPGTANRLSQTGATVADVVFWGSDIGAARIQAHAAAFTAPWDGDTTGARVGRILDVVGWPADLRDIETGDSTLGPAVFDGKAGAVLKRVEAAEQGRAFVTRDGKLRFLNRTWFATETTGSTSQATFTDTLAGIRYAALAFDFDDRLVYNRVRGSRVDGTELEARDQSSIDAYGEQVDDYLSDVALPTDAVLRSHLAYRLSRYKDPHLRARPIEIALHSLNPTQQATVLALDVGHRVTLRRTPKGVGAAIVQETFVEAISHRGSGQDHRVTLALSPIDTTPSAVWDVSRWDDATALWGI